MFMFKSFKSGEKNTNLRFVGTTRKKHEGWWYVNLKWWYITSLGLSNVPKEYPTWRSLVFFFVVANSFWSGRGPMIQVFDKGPNKHKLGPWLIQYSTFKGGNPQLLFWDALNHKPMDEMWFSPHILRDAVWDPPIGALFTPCKLNMVVVPWLHAIRDGATWRVPRVAPWDDWTHQTTNKQWMPLLLRNIHALIVACSHVCQCFFPLSHTHTLSCISMYLSKPGRVGGFIPHG